MAGNIEQVLHGVIDMQLLRVGGYSSAAEALDEELKINNIKSDLSFAGKYVYPGKQSAAEYEKRLTGFQFCDEIITAKEKLQGLAEYADILEEVCDRYGDVRECIAADAVWMREHNPVLKNIREGGDLFMLFGCCYRYLPEDIDYFISCMQSENRTIPSRKDESDFNKLLAAENICLFHRLSPEHRKYLQDIIFQARQGEVAMTAEGKKQQMLQSYLFREKQINKAILSAEQMDMCLMMLGMASDPMFAYDYVLPEGWDYQKLKRLKGEIGFYAEIIKEDSAWMKSMAPKSLMTAVQELCRAELPKKQAEWKVLAESIVRLNPELRQFAEEDLSRFFGAICHKLSPEDWNSRGKYTLGKDYGIWFYSPGERNLKKMQDLLLQKSRRWRFYWLLQMGMRENHPVMRPGKK